MDGVERLHKVLANEKAADDKLWTGADKVAWIRLVFFIQWHHYGFFHCFFPGCLELFSPQGQLSKPPNIVHHQIKLLIIAQPSFDIKTHTSRLRWGGLKC